MTGRVCHIVRVIRGVDGAELGFWRPGASEYVWCTMCLDVGK